MYVRPICFALTLIVPILVPSQTVAFELSEMLPFGNSYQEEKDDAGRHLFGTGELTFRPNNPFYAEKETGNGFFAFHQMKQTTPDLALYVLGASDDRSDLFEGAAPDADAHRMFFNVGKGVESGFSWGFQLLDGKEADAHHRQFAFLAEHSSAHAPLSYSFLLAHNSRSAPEDGASQSGWAMKQDLAYRLTSGDFTSRVRAEFTHVDLGFGANEELDPGNQKVRLSYEVDWGAMTAEFGVFRQEEVQPAYGDPLLSNGVTANLTYATGAKAEVLPDKVTFEFETSFDQLVSEDGAHDRWRYRSLGFGFDWDTPIGSFHLERMQDGIEDYSAYREDWQETRWELAYLYQANDWSVDLHAQHASGWELAGTSKATNAERSLDLTVAYEPARRAHYEASFRANRTSWRGAGYSRETAYDAVELRTDFAPAFAPRHGREVLRAELALRYERSRYDVAGHGSDSGSFEIGGVYALKF